MKLLGLSGRMGAGKDHLFKQLDRVFPEAVRLAFADGVKLDIAETLKLSGRSEDALYSKPYKPEIRRLLQWWGTELRRGENPNFWVDYADNRLVDLPEDSLVVFTDVRFQNEAAWIQTSGGRVVSIEAPVNLRAERLGLTRDQVLALAGHPSEAEVTDVMLMADEVILNNDNDDHAARALERYVSAWLSEGS